jgi:hypothetical protein
MEAVSFGLSDKRTSLAEILKTMGLELSKDINYSNKR